MINILPAEHTGPERIQSQPIPQSDWRKCCKEEQILPKATLFLQQFSSAASAPEHGTKRGTVMHAQCCSRAIILYRVVIFNGRDIHHHRAREGGTHQRQVVVLAGPTIIFKLGNAPLFFGRFLWVCLKFYFPANFPLDEAILLHPLPGRVYS